MKKSLLFIHFLANINHIDELCLSEDIFFSATAKMSDVCIEVKRERNDESMRTDDIFDAAKYIVALHFQASRNYSCGRTKIEKLLAVADLISQKKSDSFFPQYHLYINACGIGYGILAKLPNYFPMDNIIAEQDGETNRYNGKETIPLDVEPIQCDEKKQVPEKYVVDIKDHTLKEVLKDVFCMFGAYTAKQIGTTIDEFKEELKSAEPDPQNMKYYVSNERVRTYFASKNSELYRTNAIVRYITDYQLEK